MSPPAAVEGSRQVTTPGPPIEEATITGTAAADRLVTGRAARDIDILLAIDLIRFSDTGLLLV
jgi:hypothetical protein